MILQICWSGKKRSPYLLHSTLKYLQMGKYKCLGLASKVSKRTKEYRGNKIGHNLLNKEAGWWKHGVHQYCFLYCLYLSEIFVVESWKNYKRNERKYFVYFYSNARHESQIPSLQYKDPSELLQQWKADYTKGILLNTIIYFSGSGFFLEATLLHSSWSVSLWYWNQFSWFLPVLEMEWKQVIPLIKHKESVLIYFQLMQLTMSFETHLCENQHPL